MLVELVVRDLGVIEEARLVLEPGMTALTGETGAGKTMLVEALRLLTGEKPDTSRVRSGAGEAVVEGLFVVEDTEWALRRVVPRSGRSRSYLNGELCTSATLGDTAGALLEIHGQHSQQALLSGRIQRRALDLWADVDAVALAEARDVVRRLEAELADLGGDERARSRKIDLLAHQIGEISSADPRPGEEAELEAEEEVLASALEHRAAGEVAIGLLGDEGAALDAIARAAAGLEGRGPFAEAVSRLGAVAAELTDCLSELRSGVEVIEPDPERLDEIGRRRAVLADLRRKYGETVEEILVFGHRAQRELEQLTTAEERSGELAGELERARRELDRVGREVGGARRSAAPALAAEITRVLDRLALGGARVEVEVQDTPEVPGAGEAVSFLFAAGGEERCLLLTKVASGGELSRVMLALRLVLSGGPPTMVFDEVDAGVGGEAAVSVGAALADLAVERQVLVVTHLAAVAAHADSQIAVAKEQVGSTPTTTALAVDGDERVVELSRMLSGSPSSDTAREHAAELLGVAGASKVARGGR